MDRQYILSTNNLSKEYNKKKAVDRVDLSIGDGEIYGLLGKNGAGKTTLMKMLTSLVTPTEGSIHLLGKPLKEYSNVLLNIGSVIEVPVFYYHLSAIDNLRIYCKYKEIDEAKIPKFLELVGLSEEKGKKVKDFSLGMKQRLGIARAILGEPRLLILDEPINGLDPEGIRDIRNLLLHLSRDCNTSIILSSHILGEIEATADKVGFMNTGKLIKEMDKKELQETMEALFEIEVISINTELPKMQEHLEVLKVTGDIIRIRSDYTYVELLQQLKDYNVKFREVKISRAGLEDIFMEIA